MQEQRHRYSYQERLEKDRVLAADLVCRAFKSGLIKSDELTNFSQDIDGSPERVIITLRSLPEREVRILRSTRNKDTSDGVFRPCELAFTVGRERGRRLGDEIEAVWKQVQGTRLSRMQRRVSSLLRK